MTEVCLHDLYKTIMQECAQTCDSSLDILYRVKHHSRPFRYVESQENVVVFVAYLYDVLIRGLSGNFEDITHGSVSGLSHIITCA